jgi:hypothetical protein
MVSLAVWLSSSVPTAPGAMVITRTSCGATSSHRVSGIGLTTNASHPVQELLLVFN